MKASWPSGHGEDSVASQVPSPWPRMAWAGFSCSVKDDAVSRGGSRRLSGRRNAVGESLAGVLDQLRPSAVGEGCVAGGGVLGDRSSAAIPRTAMAAAAAAAPAATQRRRRVRSTSSRRFSRTSSPSLRSVLMVISRASSRSAVARVDSNELMPMPPSVAAAMRWRGERAASPSRG